ncbi:MAG: 50S ribosomal protein L11 methyltransferase [Casimicrobiaceae bacterium]
MPYIALRFDVTAGVADHWADALLETGALSVDAADAHADTPDETAVYGEPDVPSAVWPVTRLTALFGADADVAGAMTRASVMLARTPPQYVLEAVPDSDWVRATQKQFGSLKIAERLWIVPTWSEPEDAGAINLRIDPGLAFGTGSHATTRLCLRWLEAHLPRDATVLDYGCGSGILAIAAAKLGASSVRGVDVDAQAIAASAANARANGVDARFDLPDALPPMTFDVVVANILANPLELLAPLLGARVCTGGHIVLSGILEAQATRAAAAYARWFKIAPWGSEDGWVALVGNRTHERR